MEMEENMPEELIEDVYEEAITEEEHSKQEQQINPEGDAEPPPSQPEEVIEQKFMTIDLPFIDDQGVEVMRRVNVPVIRELKERKYKIIKRKRMVSRGRRSSTKDAEEEVEEEYDTCVLVETVTKTVLIRDVGEDGNVEEREEDFKEEYLIGKERKFKLVKVEKQGDDGETYEVDEIEVESEIEEESIHKRKRKRRRILIKHYNSENECT